MMGRLAERAAVLWDLGEDAKALGQQLDRNP